MRIVDARGKEPEKYPLSEKNRTGVSDPKPTVLPENSCGKPHQNQKQNQRELIFLRAGCRTRARTRHTTALAKSRRLDTSLGTAARASKRAERE